MCRKAGMQACPYAPQEEASSMDAKLLRALNVPTAEKRRTRVANVNYLLRVLFIKA